MASLPARPQLQLQRFLLVVSGSRSRVDRALWALNPVSAEVRPPQSAGKVRGINALQNARYLSKHERPLTLPTYRETVPSLGSPTRGSFRFWLMMMTDRHHDDEEP